MNLDPPPVSGVNVQLAVHVEEAGAAASELAERGVTIV
jgi:hypothetical protein